MSHLSRLRILALATLALALSMVASSRVARAGTLQVRDESHVLAPDDVVKLRALLGAAPFDGRLVVTSDYPETQEFSRYVGSLVSEPDQVVVGIDPRHRHVQVHFGTGSRIPSSAWSSIERAGNAAFARGDWESGAAAVFQDAIGAVSPGGSREVAPSQHAAPSLMGPGTVTLLILAVLGVGLVAFLFRRRAGGPMAGGGPGYGGSYPGGPGGYGGYGGGPPQGGLGPVGGGLIGAGLGGLAGYELGKMEGERERGFGSGGGVAPAGNDTPNDGGGNFDAGGGGSDWGGGDSGGGGFDGGGGDSGGGSDF